MSEYSIRTEHKTLKIEPSEEGDFVYLSIESTGDRPNEIQGDTISIPYDDIEYVMTALQRAMGKAYMTRSEISGGTLYDGPNLGLEPVQGFGMGHLGGAIRKTR